MKEIILLMGYPAAGKTTLVQEFVVQGYHRINRDELGGTLDDVAKEARIAIQQNLNWIVLDNTYPTPASRKTILDVGKEFKIPVRCVWLDTSFEDAQLNACLRMVQRTGKVMQPEEFKNTKDSNLFPPVVIFKYKKEFIKPTKAEGFSAIDKRKFVRIWPSHYTNKAVILDYDDTLRRSTGPKNWPEDPSEVEILPGRKEKLQQLIRDGFILLGVSNQSAIAKGLDRQKAIQCFQRTNELLGVDIPFMFCPHKVPPVTCFCRKPHTGIAAKYILEHNLDPSQCIMVGDQTTDKTFAVRAGFQFEWAKDFFK